MATITNPNWYDTNADRDYPFLDGVSRVDVGGGYTIPNDLIVDLRISAPPSLDATAFFISRLRAFGTGLLIDISVDGVGVVATAALPGSTGEEYQAFRVTGAPGQAVSGTVVLGGASQVLAANIVDYSFAAAATPIVPTLITPAQGGVTALTIRDAVGNTVRLTGDVTIAEGENASLAVAAQQITVGMASGVVVDPCGCDDPGGLNRSAIRSINGVGPDGAGDISIVTEGCPELTTFTNGIKLTDRCAEPCCGEDELNALTEAIQDLDRLLADYARRASQLEGSVRDVEAWLVQ